MIRLRSVFSFISLIAVAPLVMADEVIEGKYNRSCKMCHEAGLMEAPKTGDKEAWAPRLAQGDDVLLKHTMEGFKLMPAKGLCQDCTEDDYRKLIDKMSAR